jgi:hypothetical protein
MAIEIVGPDWTHLDEKSRRFLIELIGKILYRQLDKALFMLMEVDEYTFREIEIAATRLVMMCTAIRED